MGRKKANQESLPGMEARDVPEIEQAADRYRQIRDERCALSKEEAEAKAALIQAMKNGGRQFYSYNGLNVQLSNVENVKVKSKDEDDEEPTGNFTQPKRKRSAEEIAEGWIEQAEELIEQQAEEGDGFHPGFPPGFDVKRAEQGLAQESEEERERLHREAVANWRRERPASRELPTYEAGIEEDIDYQEEWFAALTAEEREKYHGAPCTCPHTRDWHGEKDKEVCERHCGACKCEQYHCPVCDTKGGHQATCEHYVLGEGTPVQKADDFTAPRCDECGRIDGAHTKECSKSDALRFDDYLAYAQAHFKRNWSSHARKMELTKMKDEEVRAWKQQASSGVKAEPEPKKESKKLSPVEAAIDR